MIKTKMIYFVFVCLFLISHTNAFCQTNLVPNGSFELFNNCPKANSAVDLSTTNFPYIQNWYRPSKGTADYYHACNTQNNSVGVPSNEAGYQQAHDGNGYIGAFVYYNVGLPGLDNFREYIQVKLNEPLKADSFYELIFYIASDNVVTSGNIGAYLSDIIFVDYNLNSNFKVTPQVSNTNPILDTSIWYKVSGEIKAKGGEQWLTIGNFQNDISSTIYNINTGNVEPNRNITCYTLIDNVSLIIKPKNKVKFLCSPTDSVEINVLNPVRSFKWFDNDVVKTTRHFKTEQTVKIDYVLMDGSNFTEFFDVKKTPNIYNKLVFDNSICGGTNLTFNIKKGDASFVWSNGKTDSFFVINNAGKCWLTAKENNCTRVDTFLISNKPVPNILYFPDTFFCDKKNILIGNNNYNDNYTFLWNNTSKTKQLLVTNESKNILAIKDSFCWAYDTIEVIKKPLPKTGIFAPSTLCTDNFDTILVKANTFTSNFWYPQNTSGTSIFISQPGKYWHTATNNWGCSQTDTIEIKDACLPQLFIPSGFTPNGDGLNDTFNCVGKYISYFELKIFDRWGGLVFETQNFDTKWTGNGISEPLPNGVYVYDIKYGSLATRQVFTKSGTITIIR